jgi:hypothetical protein
MTETDPCECGHQSTQHRMTMALTMPMQPIQTHECRECPCPKFKRTKRGAIK